MGAGWSLGMRILTDTGSCSGEMSEDFLTEGGDGGESARSGTGYEKERHTAADVEHCVWYSEVWPRRAELWLRSDKNHHLFVQRLDWAMSGVPIRLSVHLSAVNIHHSISTPEISPFPCQHPTASTTMPSTPLPTTLLPPALVTASTHFHTVLLLSSLAVRLPDLIASPGVTLTRTALPLAALQTAYLLLTSTSAAPAAQKTHPSTPKPASGAAKSKKTIRTKKTTSAPLAIVTSLLFTLAIGTPLLFLLLVAFGAPATSHHPETLSTAAHLALLSVYPLTFTRGLDAAKWRDVLALSGEIDEAIIGALGTCVGAWAGAMPIPLGMFLRSFIMQPVANDRQTGTESGRSGRLRSWWALMPGTRWGRWSEACGKERRCHSNISVTDKGVVMDEVEDGSRRKTDSGWDSFSEPRSQVCGIG